jgi:hypothetical protein
MMLPRRIAPHRAALVAAAVAAVALLAPAGAAAATGPSTGSTTRVVVLKPTPTLLRQLRAARSTGVGPLTGRRCFPDGPGTKPVCDTFVVRWARYRGKEYAAAVFWRKETGFTDGAPASCSFPDAVNRAWGWEPCPDE